MKEKRNALNFFSSGFNSYFNDNVFERAHLDL